jgi:hypothetical protein
LLTLRAAAAGGAAFARDGGIAAHQSPQPAEMN